MKNDYLCIIQARTGSSRLPGKVLLDLNGQCVLARVIERVKDAGKIDMIIVATTNRPEDQQIAEICKKLGIDCFRGSENDVLDRYYQSAKKFGFKNIIRITADCPLIDPEIIDKVIDLFEQENLDYSTNLFPYTFPDGFDTEVFSFEALEKAWQNTNTKTEREHVTVYLWKNFDKFKNNHFTHHLNLSNRRWVLDNPQDYQLIKKVYEELYPVKPKFRLSDLLEYFENNSSLEEINKYIQRNEGLAKSIKEENNL